MWGFVMVVCVFINFGIVGFVIIMGLFGGVVCVIGVVDVGVDIFVCVCRFSCG